MNERAKELVNSVEWIGAKYGSGARAMMEGCLLWIGLFGSGKIEGKDGNQTT